MKDKKVGGVTPNFVREYASRTMFLRMKQCYTDVKAYAKENGIRYDWWVRTRPDLIYYHNLPTVTELGGRSDTIYARSRRVGTGYTTVSNEAVSYWDYVDICGAFQCTRVMNSAPGQPGKPRRDVPENNAKCSVIDDQFGYIPNAFAAVYFDSPPDPADPDTAIATAAKVAAGGDAGYLIPATHAKTCMWPEGQLTCRLLKGGAKIDLLAGKMRLVKWCTGRDKIRCRDNWGNGGKCRGSPWDAKKNPKPKTVADSNWFLLKERTPKKDAPTTAAEGTGCMTVQGEGGQNAASVTTACGSWCFSLQDCNYFWVYKAGQLVGRCCTKTTFNAGLGFNEKPNVGGGGAYYEMTEKAPRAADG